MTRYVGPRCRARELSGSAAAAANKRRAWTTSKMNGRRAAVIDCLTSIGFAGRIESRARGLFPFPILGIDTDNGSEFINEDLLAYCSGEQITFTRGRVGNKNDQCFVEQKNGSIVRQLVGYDRFEGERAYRQLAELYRAVRLYVNGFQPSMKLRTKHRTGTHVRRTYDMAQTPLQRLLASGVVPAEGADRLTASFAALDPVLLLRQIETLQDALWRHAVFPTSALAAPPGGPA